MDPAAKAKIQIIRWPRTATTKMRITLSLSVAIVDIVLTKRLQGAQIAAKELIGDPYEPSGCEYCFNSHIFGGIKLVYDKMAYMGI